MEGKVFYDLAQETVSHLAAAFDLRKQCQRCGKYLVQKLRLLRPEAEALGVVCGERPAGKVEVGCCF